MHNVQADGISLALLRNYSPNLYYLSFEPISIKKSEISDIKIGDIIDIGSKLPQSYIYSKGTVVGQAKLGMIEGKEAIVISAKERIVDTGKPDAKSVAMECRLAIIPEADFVVSTLVHIPTHSIENILLVVNKKPIAMARLVDYDSRFALQIKEVF